MNDQLSFDFPLQEYETLSYLETRYLEAQRKLADYRNISNKRYEEEARLSGDVDEIKLMMLKTGNVLSEASWDLEIGHKGSVYLKGATPRNVMRKASKLLSYFETDYHCNFDIEPGINLRFDDSDISLYFKDSSNILSFAERFNIKIDTVSLQKKVDEHASKANSYREIIERFK